MVTVVWIIINKNNPKYDIMYYNRFVKVWTIKKTMVGLDSEKRIFSEKMRKERKKRGKEAKK